MRERRLTATTDRQTMIELAGCRSNRTSIFKITKIAIPVLLAAFAARDAVAQVKELPIEKPKERTTTETVRVRTQPRQQTPTTGVLVVLLNPIVPGKVVVRNEAGKVLKQGDADREGQAEFLLERNKQYKVEATSPGYSSGVVTSNRLTGQTIVRVPLNAKSRVLRLASLPQGAVVLIDTKQVTTTLAGGVATVEGVTPARHSLLVRHPEYNDYIVDIDFSGVGIGEAALLYVTPERASKLTINSNPGATILIDGSFRGRVPASGKLEVSLALVQASDHSITSELTGYVSKTVRERLAPGPRVIDLPLERIAEAVGVSDGFDELSLWSHPPTWKVITEGDKRRVQVAGTAIGLLKGKDFRDFDAVFTFWMLEDKGVTWALKADSTGKNYYLFHLSGPKSTNPLPKRFFTFVVRDGAVVSSNTPTPFSFTFTPGTSYTINISVRGYRIEHSITSNETGEKSLLGQFTDTSATKDSFLFGQFGFRAYSTEVFLIDDLTIEPAKETDTTRPR
jgi:hypothetical protein